MGPFPYRAWTVLEWVKQAVDLGMREYFSNMDTIGTKDNFDIPDQAVTP